MILWEYTNRCLKSLLSETSLLCKDLREINSITICGDLVTYYNITRIGAESDQFI